VSDLDESTLVAHVDGELDPATTRKVAQAIERDPAAQEKARLLRLSGSLVHSAFRDPAYKRVSPRLAAAVRAASSPTSGRVRARDFIMPLAASILAAAIFAGGFMLGADHPWQPDFSDRLLDEVADYHVVYARESEHQVEVPGPRLAHIQAWLGERLHRKLNVPDLSGRGLTFQGARLLVVDGQPVAQLVYGTPDRPREPLALCISFGAAGEEPLRTESRDDVSLALWRRNGYTYVLVGWADKKFLSELAAHLMPKLDQG
jgi:anti-sigma factor RsiW